MTQYKAPALIVIELVWVLAEDANTKLVHDDIHVNKFTSRF